MGIGEALAWLHALLCSSKLKPIFLCDFVGHVGIYIQLIGSDVVYSCNLTDLVPLRGLVGASS
jgi:hypothetical protein